LKFDEDSPSGSNQKAFEQYKKTSIWRKSTIESRGDFYSSAPVLEEYFGTRSLLAFHGVDKVGRPILIERMGHINYDAMLRDLPEEKLLERHIWQNEEMNRRMRHMAKKTNTDIHQVVMIMDLKDFKIQVTNQKLSMFKAILSIDSTYYPETLGQVFIVNAPSMFGSVWSIVSYFLDKKTKDKIRFLNASQFDAMLEFIDPHQLPLEYGGTCNQCREGHKCLPDSDEPYVPSRMNYEGSIQDMSREISKDNLYETPITPSSSEREAETDSETSTVSESQSLTASMKEKKTIYRYSELKVETHPKRLGSLPAGIMRSTKVEQHNKRGSLPA